MIDKDILEASINIVLRAFEDCLVYATASKDALDKFGANGCKDKGLLKWAIKSAARGEVTIKHVLEMLHTGEVTVQLLQRDNNGNQKQL